MDWSIIAIILQLIFLEGILSIDNAAVLGAMVSVLPDDKGIPWPRSLLKLGKILNPVLGKERMAALRVGILGAYLGRGIMLVLASFVVRNPWLRLVGAFYLIRLAFENLAIAEEGEEERQEREARARGFWIIVLNVELADLAFSLDNVVAAVSLSNKLWVVMVGVAIGILTMRFAAGLFSYAVLREPVLKPAAYVLVLNIGIQLILEDIMGVEIADLTRFMLSVSIILLALIYAHFKPLHALRPVLLWLALGMDRLNEVINWLLIPLVALLRLLFRPVRWVYARFFASRLHLAKKSKVEIK
jgi:tellurite resistance protein TerC